MSARARVNRDIDPPAGSDDAMDTEPSVVDADATERKPDIEPKSPDAAKRKEVLNEIGKKLADGKKLVDEAAADLSRVAAGEIGTEGAVKITAEEKSNVVSLEKRLITADERRRVLRLEGDLEDQLDLLESIQGTLQAYNEKNTTEGDLALYRKLYERGATQDKNTGNYSKVNAEEQARLQKIEGPHITDEIVAKMCDGEIPWTSNGAFRAISRLRGGRDPKTGKRFKPTAVRPDADVHDMTGRKLSAAEVAALAAGGVAAAAVGAAVLGGEKPFADDDISLAQLVAETKVSGEAKGFSEIMAENRERELGEELNKLKEEEDRLKTELEDLNKDAPKLIDLRLLNDTERLDAMVENRLLLAKYLRQYDILLADSDELRLRLEQQTDEQYLNEVIDPEASNPDVNEYLEFFDAARERAVLQLDSTMRAKKIRLSQILSEREDLLMMNEGRKDASAFDTNGKSLKELRRQLIEIKNEIAEKERIIAEGKETDRVEALLLRTQELFADNDDISVPLLRSKLNVDYTTASGLFLFLDEQGAIAPQVGKDKPRKFLHNKIVVGPKSAPITEDADLFSDLVALRAEQRELENAIAPHMTEKAITERRLIEIRSRINQCRQEIKKDVDGARLVELMTEIELLKDDERTVTEQLKNLAKQPPAIGEAGPQETAEDLKAAYKKELTDTSKDETIEYSPMDYGGGEPSVNEVVEEENETPQTRSEVMTKTRSRIASYEINLAAVSIDDLQTELTALDSANPIKAAKKMGEKKLLSDDEAKLLSDKDIRALKMELSSLYWKAINDKRNPPPPPDTPPTPHTVVDTGSVEPSVERSPEMNSARAAISNAVEAITDPAVIEAKHAESKAILDVAPMQTQLEGYGIAADELKKMADADIVALHDAVNDALVARLEKLRPATAKGETLDPAVLFAKSEKVLSDIALLDLDRISKMHIPALVNELDILGRKIRIIESAETQDAQYSSLKGLHILTRKELKALDNEQLKKLAEKRLADLRAAKAAVTARLPGAGSAEPKPAAAAASTTERERTPEAIYEAFEAGLGDMLTNAQKDIDKADARALDNIIRKAKAKLRDIGNAGKGRADLLRGLDSLEILDLKELDKLKDPELKRLAEKRVNDLETIRGKAEAKLGGPKKGPEPKEPVVDARQEKDKAMAAIRRSVQEAMKSKLAADEAGFDSDLAALESKETAEDFLAELANLKYLTAEQAVVVGKKENVGDFLSIRNEFVQANNKKARKPRAPAPPPSHPKAGARQAVVAAAPEKPPEPPKPPEKGECLGIARRFLNDRAALLERKLEQLDHQNLFDVRKALDSVSADGFRKYLKEAGLDATIADGLNEQELQGLLSTEKVHVDNLLAAKNPVKEPTLTSSLAEQSSAKRESRKKKNKREKK